MRWTLEILVFLVFAGMAAPVVWRLRGLSVLRAALSREPPYMRVAACAFFAAAVIYGGGKGDGGGNGGGDGEGDGGDPPLRGGLPNQSPPQWYLDCGYDAADTDGDGIPDCWERWTGTDPRLADSGEDLDDDALTNLDEFMLQTDPQCADTDNDGLPDALEAAAAAAGFLFADPISPASFEASETDTDGDGMPDCWEGASAPLFPGVETNGFPVGVSVAQESEWNYDVLLSVTTSRHALLSWGDGYSSSAFVIPPCSGLVLRLRLDAFATQTVTLTAIPDDQANLVPGAWRGGLTAEWDGRRGLPTDGNRIEPNSGVFVDKEGEEGVRAEFLGWSAGGLRSGGGAGTSSIDFLAKPWVMSLTDYVGCTIHEGGTTVELYEENVPPPYIWTCGDSQSGETAATSILVTASDLPGDNHVTVSVRQNDGIHSNLYPYASITTWLDHCNGGITNFIGAMAGSTHNPNDPSDHLPRVYPEYVPGIGLNCPTSANLVVKAGWTHNAEILHIRNLVRIITGDPWDDETDHCIGLVWSAGGSINLYDYLADESKPFVEFFDYYVNDVENNGTLVFDPEPDEFHPSVFHVELRLAGVGTVLDRMWVVVNAASANRDFCNWHRVNSTNTAWTATLPKPYAHISLSTNYFGIVSAIDPEPGNPNQWGSPSSLTSWIRPRYLHHDAKWEMRSKADADNHSNQACYDANGAIIRSGLAAGTADFVVGDLGHSKSHVRNDVDPYLHAVHLDGNPGDTQNDNGLSRPCLYQGTNVTKYIECRPIILPEGEQE